MSTSQSDNFTKLLRDNGHSNTTQRQLVFNELLGQEPMTMHDLIARLNSKLDRASIYRAISLFEVLNIVQRLNIGWKYKIELTDKFAEHHHHLTCLKCGQVISINEGELEDFVHKSARINGFKVTAHQIEIQGYCSRCS